MQAKYVTIAHYMKQVKAIIFDFDGLMVNSEELREEAMARLISEYGKQFRHEDYLPTMTQLRGAEAVNGFLMKKYGIDDDILEFGRKRTEYFHELFESRLELMDGISDVIGDAKEAGVMLAVASNRNKQDVVDGLTRLGVLDNFYVVVNSDELESRNMKPDPEIYLVTAQKLGVEPSECLVLEDSVDGAQAARAAGMRVIQVPDARYNDGYHDEAEMVLMSMTELRREVLQRLINPRGIESSSRSEII